MTNTDSKKIGRIYQMINMMTNKIYIGATFSPLHKRMYERKKTYNRWLEGKVESDRKLFNSIYKYGWEAFRTEILEEVEVKNKQELFKIEGDWIRKKDSFKNGLNGRIEAQTQEEKKQQQKEWRESNKDKMKIYEKRRYKKDKEKRLDKVKKWRENNKDKVKEHQTKFEKKYKVKVKCECGSMIRKDGVKQHLKSKKHKELMKNKEESKKTDDKPSQSEENDYFNRVSDGDDDNDYFVFTNL